MRSIGAFSKGVLALVLRRAGTAAVAAAPHAYGRIGKLALIQQQRHGHAKQFMRPTQALKAQLEHVMRNLGRKIRGRAPLE